MLEMAEAALARRRSPSEVDSSSKESESSEEPEAAFVLLMSAEESENEPKLRAEADEALLSRRRRGTMGESVAALTRAFMVPLRCGIFNNMIDGRERQAIKQCNAQHKRTRYGRHFFFGAIRRFEYTSV